MRPGHTFVDTPVRGESQIVNIGSQIAQASRNLPELRRYRPVECKSMSRLRLG